MTESEHLFIDLEPPPGGLRRLQCHVAAPPSPPRLHKLQFAAALAVAVVVVAGLWLPTALTQRHRQDELVQALRQATAPPAGGIRIIGGAAIELPSGRSGARIYLVQSGGPAAHAGHD